MARGHVRALQFKAMGLKRELEALRLARRAMRLGISPDNLSVTVTDKIEGLKK
jgi:hypothetical protein